MPDPSEQETRFQSWGSLKATSKRGRRTQGMSHDP